MGQVTFHRVPSRQDSGVLTSIRDRCVDKDEKKPFLEKLWEKTKKRYRFGIELYFFNRLFSNTPLGPYSYFTVLGMTSSIIGGTLALDNVAHIIFKSLFVDALVNLTILFPLFCSTSVCTNAVLAIAVVAVLFKPKWDCDSEKGAAFIKKLLTSLYLNLAWCIVACFKKNAGGGSFFIRWGMKDVLHYTYMNPILCLRKEDPEGRTSSRLLIEALLGCIRGFLRFRMISFVLEQFPLNPGFWQDLVKIFITMIAGGVQDTARHVLKNTTI